jgi:KDO2-lipid IV(A) lauroyltransferase
VVIGSRDRDPVSPEPTLPSLIKRIRHAIEVAALYTLYRATRVLPWNWLGPVGRALGRVAHDLVPIRRAVVRTNLRMAFPSRTEKEIRELARRFYATLGVTLLEFFTFYRLGRDRILALTEIENEDVLIRLRDSGLGALLVSGHYGNWELMGAALAARGYPVRFLAKSQSNWRVDREQNALRAKVGLGVIREGSAREIVRALRRGDLIGLLADQDAGPGGIFVDFLGRPASVFRGPAYLAWKLRCPIVTGTLRRGEDGIHRVRVEGPIMPDQNWDEESALRILTEAHTRPLERAIRAAPEHYYWLHRRWKTPPPQDHRPDSGGNLTRSDQEESTPYERIPD